MSKKPVRIRLLTEGLISLIIALSPLVFYSYKYTAPDTSSIDFLFIEITPNGFPDARSNLWFILIKFVPFTLLLVWFLTCKDWWYHVILIPMAMFAFQCVQAFRDTDTIDENEIMYVIGVTMVIAPIVYFIRLKLVDKYVHGIDLKAMDDELKLLKEKEELREEWAKLEKRKEELEKKM
ncbi:hypothetical protein [Croceivirga thetidis]|uniref:Uncharacterized protein n=1 Tax=Croceivirga thetidis TaxID=2721623 RepID=A0ABX1GQL0_9FLAO|nr:hypothetical protein [Croceivirga thetidis]NKI32222.1 hypothetical protein [Croceivirga thetidis]